MDYATLMGFITVIGRIFAGRIQQEKQDSLLPIHRPVPTSQRNRDSVCSLTDNKLHHMETGLMPPSDTVHVRLCRRLQG